MEDRKYGTPWRCACCGVIFRTPCERLRDWGYAVGSRPCCSYGCMRKLDRELTERRKKRTVVTQRAMVYEDFARGMRYCDLAKKWKIKSNDIANRMILFEAEHPDLAMEIQERIRREAS